MSLVIVPWLLLQSFNRFFLIECYLYSSFCFNISSQFLLTAIRKGFCLIAQEGFGSLILKMPVNLAQYRVTVGIFNNRQIIISLHYEASLYSGMSNNSFNYGSGYSSLIFFFFFCALFLSKGNILKITAKFCVPFFLFHNIGAHILVCVYSLLLMLSGDVEMNPGPCKELQRIFLNLPLESQQYICP